MVHSSEMSDGVFQGGQVTDRNENHEQAWSTNDIRKNSNNWTLAGDIGLLNNLKEFSHRLVSRTHEIEKLVDSLIHQSEETSAKVNNVINDFQMLANLQFVENRVYDDDTQDTNVEKKAEPQPKSQEQKESEMISRVTQALQIGIKVLDIAFDRIDVEETSDSDEDEDQSEGRILLEPKDIYENRPLPFIIGTNEFKDDDFAGMRNLIEEDLSQEISTPEENLSASEESETESEEDEPPKKPVSSTFRNAQQNNIENVDKFSQSDASSELFDEKDEDEDFDLISEEPVVKPVIDKKPVSLIEELANKTKTQGEVKEPEALNQSVQSPEKIQTRNESDDLFANADEEDNDLFQTDDSPFRKTTGLFSGKSLLSNDIEESYEGDLFKSMEQETKANNKPKAVKENVSERKASKTSILLEDDIDEEDQDLFGMFSKNLSETLSPKSGPKEFGKPEKIEKISVGSSTKSNPALVKNIEKKTVASLDDKGASDSLFGDDSDEGDLFSKPVKTKKNTSFSFDDDAHLFSTEPPKLKIEGAKEKTKIDSITDSLFEESDNFDLFKPKETKSKSNVKKDNISETKKSSGKKQKLSMLEDSDDFGLFKTNAKKAEISVLKTEEQPNTLKLSEDVVEDNSNIKQSNSIHEELITPSFDSPMDSTNILSTVNKDRVKIQSKRRKPTRKGRQALITTESEEISEIQIENQDNLFTAKNETEKVSKDEIVSVVSEGPKTNFKNEQQNNRNLMSQLMSEAAESRVGKKSSFLGKQSSSESDEDDLFSNSNKKLPKNTTEQPNITSKVLTTGNIDPEIKYSTDNLISGSKNLDSISDDELFSAPSFQEFRNSISEKNSLFGDENDSDDIFKSSKADSVSQSSSNLLEENDDIFAGMEKEKYEMFPTQLLEEDDDDDDIFSNLEKPKKLTNKTSSNAAQEKKKSNDIFNDPLAGFVED